jgi:ribosomal protein S3
VCVSFSSGAARSKHFVIKSGNIPLQTFHANIDYAESAAHARAGVFGVKVWLFQRKLDRKEMQSYSLLRGGKRRTRNKFL